MVSPSLIQLLPRQECVAGKQYYRCASPQFQGCCSVDACASNGCPDDDTSTTNSIGAAGGRNSNGGRSSSSTTATTSTPTSTAVSPTPTSDRSSTSNTDSSQPTVTVTNARPTTIVSTAPGGQFTTTKTIEPVAETQRTSPDTSSSSSKLAPILGSVFGVVGLSIVLAAVYFCYWRPRRRKRRRHMQSVYSKTGSQPYSPDMNDPGEGMDRSVKERDSRLWSIFSNKVYKPLRESKSRRLTTASEASWLNALHPSPPAAAPSPYSPDSILQQPTSPELDDTSTNVVAKRHKQPTRLSELPGSSPELRSSLTPPPPGYTYCAELPADEEATVKAPQPPSLLAKTRKKDKVRVSHNRTKSDNDGDEEERKRQTQLISPTIPEPDQPLPLPTPAQAHRRLETQPIITVNGMGIDMGTGVSSSEDQKIG